MPNNLKETAIQAVHNSLATNIAGAFNIYRAELGDNDDYLGAKARVKVAVERYRKIADAMLEIVDEVYAEPGS